MRNILTFRRMALVVFFIASLSACSNTSETDIVESFAMQRAEMLNNIVPIELNGYNLIKASAKKTQIVLTLIYTGNGDVTPTALASNLQQKYCTDNEVVSLLEQGVTYRLLFRDARGKPLLNRVIGINNCLKKVIDPLQNKKPL